MLVTRIAAAQKFLEYEYGFAQLTETKRTRIVERSAKNCRH